MVASAWSDFWELLSEQPVIAEGLLAVVLLVVVLVLFRSIRKTAAELERRKALGEYVQGLDEFLRGDHKEAIATLEKVLERDPENIEARIALGDCYRIIGDAPEAKKHHHHVHKVFGHDLARNFVSLGLDELALRNYDRAVEAFESARNLAPQDRDALAGLARAFAEGGQPVAAAQFLRELYPEGPVEGMGRAERRVAANRFCDAGAEALAEGNLDGAIRFFTEALGFSKENVRARTGLVRAAQALGDEQRAREIVEEHIGALNDLATRDDILFEPAPERVMVATEQPVDTSEALESTTSLPARLEDVSGLAAAVESRTARYACSRCGALQRTYGEICPACSAVGTLSGLESLADVYTRPMADFRETMDELDGSPAFLQALAHKASLGDEEAGRKLIERGIAALPEVFAALPLLEARRALAVTLAELGEAAVPEVRRFHFERAAALRPQAYDDFAAAFYLAAAGDAAAPYLATLHGGRDRAVAGVMADPRVPDSVREAALGLLTSWGEQALFAAVEAAALSGDPAALGYTAKLVKDGDDVARLEKRYLQATLLGRLFGKARGVRPRSGLRQASEALGRAAGREKDPALRAHYTAARERADQGGAA
ncbi:MAG: tetratricopeptide repeat protein [Planctomycetota bacterium]